MSELNGKPKPDPTDATQQFVAPPTPINQKAKRPRGRPRQPTPTTATYSQRWDRIALQRQTMIREAIQMRLKGCTFSEIAKHFGVAVSTVYENWIMPYLNQIIDENRANSAKLMQAQWDQTTEILATFYPKALSGCPKAADVVLKYMERRAKLAGMDAPTKTDNMNRGDGSQFLTREQNDAAISERLAAFLVTSKN